MDPKIGIGVFVFNDKGEVIIGERMGSHGAGTFALPGGHLEYGESFEECAARELLEETGLTMPTTTTPMATKEPSRELRFLTAVNSVWPEERKHYCTIFMACRLPDEKEGQAPEPQNLEPHKCKGWSWIHWDGLKSWALKQAAVPPKMRNEVNIKIFK